MRVRVALGVACLVSAAAFGQPAESTAKFEVADIHNSPPSSQPFVRGPFFNNVRYELRFATMLDLVRIAYGVEPENIYGGPSWLEMDRFDVFAKPPGATNAESRKQLMQALLKERFKLVAHEDTKPMPGYALTVGKRSLMKASDGSGEIGCKFDVQQTNGPAQQPREPGAPPQPIVLPIIHYTCHSTTMVSFATGMLNIPGVGQYLNNKPVIDQTGLEGAYDFELKFTPKVPPALQVTGEDIPFFDALDKQLGLKLDSANVPLPVVVVDSVERKPTANPPDVAKYFPPAPAEFEVAEIRPAAPLPPGARANPEVKNGRVIVPGITLQNLITAAWDINGDDMLIGAPKWLNSDKFDLIAKAPSSVAMGELTPTRSSIPINIDALRPMLQTLLVERFKLQVHKEDRPIPAYTLKALKPKLKPSDPNARTKWQEGTVGDAKDNKNANASLGRLVTCTNVTMAQFAEMLPVIAPGYLHTTVTDATGLEGGYDFTFSFSPVGMFQLNSGPSADGGSDAAAPNGAISLFDAMMKQLGLKLEMEKRPTPVLVIDHVEQKPIDN